MSLNIDWVSAIGGVAVGYIAKSKVEDTKDAVKKAVSETAAAAAIAAAQAVVSGQAGQSGKSNGGKNGN